MEDKKKNPKRIVAEILRATASTGVGMAEMKDAIAKDLKRTPKEKDLQEYSLEHVLGEGVITYKLSKGTREVGRFTAKVKRGARAFSITYKPKK